MVWRFIFKETCKTPKNITEILTDLYNINKAYKKFQDSGNNDDVKKNLSKQIGIGSNA